MKPHLLDGKPPEKIKKVIGTYNFKNYILEITNAPTKKRSYGVGYIIIKNRFPEELWKGSTLALEHYILNYFYKRSKKEGITWLNFQRPTSALVPRSGIEFDKNRTRIRVMFHFKTPMKGRKINGKAIARTFERVIPKMVKSVQNLDEERYVKLLEVKRSLEDQMEIKRYLAENGYLAFISSNVVINGRKVRIRNPDRIRVPNAERVEGLLIPEGRTKLSGFGIEIIELLSKGYAYYKPDSNFAFVKTIRDMAWVPKGEEWLASYAELDGVFGVGDLEYPNAITLDELRGADRIVMYKNGEISLQKMKGERMQKPKYGEIVIRKKIPKVKLSTEGISFGGFNMAINYQLSSSIIERNQLRAAVDAINFSQKYVNGSLDIMGVLTRAIKVINKRGLSSLGLGFYTEFTRWQMFYLMYKLVQANP